MRCTTFPESGTKVVRKWFESGTEVVGNHDTFYHTGKITFRHAGLSPVDENGKKNLMPDQLKQFYYSLLLQGMKKSHIPTSWIEAFFMLESHLQNIDKGKRMVVFLDELPWMDTPRSGFLSAFEGFWKMRVRCIPFIKKQHQKGYSMPYYQVHKTC